MIRYTPFPPTIFGPLLLLALMMNCTDPSTPQPQEPLTEKTPAKRPHPSLFLIGGGNYHKNDDQIPKAFIHKIAANHQQEPYIGVITAASEPLEVASDGVFYETFFKELHARAEWLDLARANKEPIFASELIKRIDTMNGFFVGGGDQAFIIQALFKKDANNRFDARVPTPVMAAIQRAVERGAIYAGTSAGAVVATGRGIPLFLNGGNYASLIKQRWSTDPRDAENDPKYNKMVVDTQGGLGFFKFGSIDTHFNERNREVRGFALGKIMQQQNIAPQAFRIFGLDEGTALVVDDADLETATLQVIGVGGVTVMDFIHAGFSPAPCMEATKVHVSYLHSGDRYNPTLRQTFFSETKTELPESVQVQPPIEVVAKFFGAPKDHVSGSEASPSASSHAAAFITTNFLLSHAQTLRIKSSMKTPQFHLTKSKIGMLSVRDPSEKEPTVSYHNMTVELTCPK